MHLEGMPITLMRLPGRSTTRGNGFPARSSRVIVLVTKAPSRLKSITFSSPSAKVPEAGMTGLRKRSAPTFTGTSQEGLLTDGRSEEHTSELQSLMRISYAVFCLKKKTYHKHTHT